MAACGLHGSAQAGEQDVAGELIGPLLRMVKVYYVGHEFSRVHLHLASDEDFHAVEAVVFEQLLYQVFADGARCADN